MAIVKYNSISVTKGIGIIFVVIAHSFAQKGILADFICLFHMPLFYFVSGYCFKEKYLNEKFIFFKRSIKTLYIPFVLTNFIFICLHNTFYELNIYNNEYGFGNGVSHLYTKDEILRQCFYTIRFKGQEQLLGGFWFLCSLFFARLLFLWSLWIYIRMKGNTKVLTLLLLSAFVFCSYGCSVRGLFGSREVFGAILIACGYMYRYLETTYKVSSVKCLNLVAGGGKINMKKLYVIISFSIVVVYAIFRPLYFSSMPWTIERLDYIIPSLCGSIICYEIAKLKYFENNKFLQFAGDNSLTILALHFISFKFVSLIYLYVNGESICKLSQFAVLWESPGYLWIFYSLVGVLTPLLFKYIYLKLSYKSNEGLLFHIRRKRRI